MSIAGVNFSQVDLQQLMNAINAAAGTEGTVKIEDIAFDAETNQLVITSSDGGVSKAFTVDIPELESPGVVDDAAIRTLVAKIGDAGLGLNDDQITALANNLVDQMKAFAKAHPANTGRMMFDLYSMLALLQECSQKLRDAAREMRTSQNIQIQKSIQDQADQQRDAALVGLVCGIVVAAVQVGAMLVNFKFQAKSWAQQAQAGKNVGLDAAQRDVKLAKLEANPQAAEANLKSVQASGSKWQKIMPNSRRGSDETVRNVETATSKSTKIEEAIHSKQAELSRADAELGEVQKKLGDARKGLEDANARLKKGNLSDAEKTELEAAKTKFEEQIPGLEKKEAEWKTKYEGLRTDISKLEADYRTQARAEIDGLQAKLDDAVAKRQALPRTASPRAKVAADRAIAQAKAEFRLGFAKNAAGLSRHTTSAQATADLASAQAAYRTGSDNLRYDAKNIEAMHLETKTQVANGVITAIGGAAQSVVRCVVDMMQAKATEMGAAEKALEEQRDEIKDLFAQCAEVVQSVRQLAQAVEQSDAQAMRDAIQV